MVPVLARMSVVIKAQHETSVMTGNYEMGYVCGLLCRLAGITPPPLETPLKLQEKMMAALEGYNAADEREKNIIYMRYFDGKTQMEVSEEIGISQAQVSRLEKSAILHMRKSYT